MKLNIRPLPCLAMLLAFLFFTTSLAAADSDNLRITFVARECTEYTAVMANRARNNIMQSLEDLGPDSIYTGQPVSPTVEERVTSQVDSCVPLNGWRFTLGEGISGTPDTGLFGQLSKVRNATRTTSPTRNGVPILNPSGQDTGNDIDGAMTLTLNSQERQFASRGTLVVQGGRPGDPLLGSGVLGFATLRCGTDNKNADNVEYAKFSGQHIFCYAYYVNPAPTAGRIIISARTENSTATDVVYQFGGNTSFTSDGTFSVRAGDDVDFTRAGVGVSGPAWTVFENTAALPQGYTFVRVECTSENSSPVAITGASVAISLLPSDTVHCTFINRKPANISPIVECTARSGVASYTGHFGYFNRESETATVAAGSNNRFTPAPENRGQPYSFLPGRKAQVFSVDHTGGPVTWTLAGRTASTSSNSAQRCHPSCILPTAIEVDRCDTSFVIDGTLSQTLNNGGEFSQFTWSTDCPGTLSDTNTLRPTLTIDRTEAGRRQTSCSVTLRVVDDTRYGSTDARELQSASCSSPVTIPLCQTDCAGIPNGQTPVDECGVCNGDNSTCLDCAGVPNGGAQVDLCGVCGGANQSCLDCAGVPNGSAVLDDCGICGGDSSQCETGSGCVGTVDACGVCDGDASSCADCAGIPNGKTEVDECGVCGGDGSTCGICRESAAVSSNDVARFKAMGADLVLLAKNAERYASEAVKCSRSRSRALRPRLVAIQELVRDITRLIQADLTVIRNQCTNSQCAVVSIELLKREMLSLARQLRGLSRDSQNIVSTCRGPIRSNSKKRDSRQLLADIEKALGRISDSVVACTPG